MVLPQTLAELTLTLSKEIERVDARCASELAAADRTRDREILEGPGKTVLERYHRALEKAKQAQLRSVESADDLRTRQILAAEDRRRKDLLREERAYRAARKKADSKKRDAVRNARKKWRDAVARARRGALDQHRRLRKRADEALEEALSAAREAYHEAIEDARLRHRAALQDDLVDERLAVEKAHREAERLITAAAIDYERAVAQEEARMRSDLTDHATARESQEAYDRKTYEIRETCEREKEALFRWFTRERRQLKRPNQRKK